MVLNKLGITTNMAYRTAASAADESVVNNHHEEDEDRYPRAYLWFLQQEVQVARFFPEAEVIFEAHVSKLPYVDNEFYYLINLLYHDLTMQQLPYAKQLIFNEASVIVTDEKAQPYYLPSGVALCSLRYFYQDADSKYRVQTLSYYLAVDIVCLVLFDSLLLRAVQQAQHSLLVT